MIDNEKLEAIFRRVWEDRPPTNRRPENYFVYIRFARLWKAGEYKDAMQCLKLIRDQKGN